MTGRMSSEMAAGRGQNLQRGGDENRREQHETSTRERERHKETIPETPRDDLVCFKAEIHKIL